MATYGVFANNPFLIRNRMMQATHFGEGKSEDADEPEVAFIDGKGHLFGEPLPSRPRLLRFLGHLLLFLAQKD